MLISGAEKKYKNTYYQRVTETIDRETGEVQKETEETDVRYSPEPPYVKMYIADLCAVVNAPNSLKDVLLMILRKLDYDGYIALSTRYRRQICAELNIKDGTLRNRLAALVKLGFVYSEGGNEYLANPNLFARGKWKDIVEQRSDFEMRIRYTSNGEKSISTGVFKVPANDMEASL